jgi:PAS domain S-box-containing protein
MNQKESSDSKPSPKTREDGDQKAKANRRVAEYSPAVAETSRATDEVRRQQVEQERIASEDSRQAPEPDRRATEEQRRDVARERELIEENQALDDNLALSQSEGAGRDQDEEERQVARVDDGSQPGIVSCQENLFHDQAEAQLRLLKMAIEQSNESIIITTAQLDPTGPQIIYVNPAFTKMTGYAPEEVIGKTPRIMQGPKTDRSVLGQLRKDCAAGKVFHGEMINYRKDRSEIHLEWNVGPVRNERGEVTHFAVAQRDVTERRGIEEALRNSEGQLRAILDHSVAVVFVKDLEGRYLRINHWYEVLHGVTEAEVKGKTDYDLHAKEVADAVRANDQEVIAANTPLQFEERVLAADGLHDFISVKFPLRDDSGRPYAICGIATDITERKRVETSLRESESRLRQYMDAMPQIIYTCHADGMSDYVNLRWQEYTGVLWERSLAAGWVESLHPDDRERAWRQWVEAVKAGQPFEVEYRVRRKDGQYRWYLSRTIPIRDEQRQIVKWIGTSTDIHDRKEAESEREELLAREQTARADAEHATESIRRLQAVIDSALTHHTLDDLLHEMLARIRELLETDSAAILILTEDGQSLAVRAAIGSEEEVGGPHIPVGQGVAGSIAASRAPLIVEDLSAVEVISPILRQKAHSLIGAPLIVEDRLIGVIRTDTTQPRRFTENDVRLLQLAADRVALAIEQARLYEVELQARRQAEEANHMKDEFLALVSHELRSPLNAILGYASLLRHGGVDAQKAKQALDVIERSGKAQALLIDDLLDTARIISGKLRLEVGPVDMVSVIEQAVQTIRPASDAKGISLEAQLPPEIVQITGDPARLQQVVWNLLSNAVKFTPQGGRIEARLERVDPYICITVSDTGKGISSDFQPFVFDRFRQADASSAKRYGGLGLGLALVKYVVELHGGTTEVKSAGEDQGATFKVTLPVRAVSSPLRGAGRGAVMVTGPESLAGVRALVVDDEYDARELLKSALTQYGAEVFAVSSAAEAYELIISAPDRERPDVLVADIGMPDEDGYSLMRRVREWERERDFYTPAVALTAYGRIEDRVRALKAGFQTHIAKPVDPAELSIVIASLIGGIPN